MFLRKKKIAKPYVLREEKDEIYIEQLSEVHGIKMENICLMFNGFFPPVSAHIAFDLFEKNNGLQIYIHNLFVPKELRQNGYGTKLLNRLSAKINRICRQTGYRTISVSGCLVPEDLEYWQYSLPMYLKFARNIMGEDIVCLINGNPVENENMVSEAYNLNKQKIAVRFEFRRANIL